jgi:methionyl-tRNA formyltransferase
MKIKTIFIGSGIFAVEIFKALMINDSILIEGIITQPAKEAGRKKELTSCPLNRYLIDNSLVLKYKMYQPVKLKLEAEAILDEIKPELIIVADYGQMLPKSIINYPKYKCLNIHGSLLPDLRGAVPIPMAILKGYKKTGVSIPIMTPGLDDGDVIGSRELEILPNDTSLSLKLKLGEIGGNLINDVLPDWLSGKITPVEQDKSLITFTNQSDIAKEKARITPEMSYIQVERMIRGFYPWPIAWGVFKEGDRELRVKLVSAKINEEVSNEQINIYLQRGLGFFKINKKIFLVLKDGALEIIKLQVEGKNEMNGNEALFLDGYICQ